MTACECPNDAGQRDAVGYDRLSVDVGFVVVIDKIVPQRLPEDAPRDRREKNADYDRFQGGILLPRMLRALIHTRLESSAILLPVSHKKTTIPAP